MQVMIRIEQKTFEIKIYRPLVVYYEKKNIQKELFVFFNVVFVSSLIQKL
jgi:hypothetical protein